MGFFREMLQTGLIPLEKISEHLYPIDIKEKYFPIFILGAPRSGSTLLIQAMTHYFDIAYMTNFTRNFFKVPLTGLWLQQHLFLKKQSMTFNSEYGKTNRLLGPNEAADFWYQWFPSGKDVYVGEGDISEETIYDIRQKIMGLLRISKKPFIFKNLYNSMRILPIRKAFPESLFIVCYRNTVDIAQSILQCREKIFGSKSLWWSVPPREYDKIKNKPPLQQVVEQVYYIYKQIEKDLSGGDAEYVFNLDYSDLCNKPTQTMKDIKHWVEKQNIRLEEQFDLPNTFQIVSGRKISEDDYKKLEHYTESLAGKIG